MAIGLHSLTVLGARAHRCGWPAGLRRRGTGRESTCRRSGAAHHLKRVQGPTYPADIDRRCTTPGRLAREA